MPSFRRYRCSTKSIANVRSPERKMFSQSTAQSVRSARALVRAVEAIPSQVHDLLPLRCDDFHNMPGPLEGTIHFL